MASDPKPPEYQPGIDSEGAWPEGIHKPDDDAWSEPVKGLSAVITAPEKLRYDDEVVVYVLLKNTSAKLIRVTLPKLIGIQIWETESTLNGGVSANNHYFTHWELAPGQIATTETPLFSFSRGDGISLKHAKDLGPGQLEIRTGIGAGGENWEIFREDGQARRVEYADDEWIGYIKGLKHRFDLLDEDAPVVIAAPEELGEGHGLVASLKRPDEAMSSIGFQLRDGLSLQLSDVSDNFWLYDWKLYDRTIYWGPFAGDALEKSGLLQLVEANLRKNLPESTLRNFVGRSKPFAKLALDLAPSIKSVESIHPNTPASRLARTIHDNRVRLREMGLGENAVAALKVLDAGLPVLPPKAEFRTIEAVWKAPILKDELWGPENDGLRAAAVMPAKIKEGDTASVKLLIKNVSKHPIFMTVSDRKGYDYATVTDTEGIELEARHDPVWTGGYFGNAIMEYNPGEQPMHPPCTTLTKLELAPGAIWIVKTKAALSYDHPARPRKVEEALTGGPDSDPENPDITKLETEVKEAVITWHLHTANGSAYSKDLRKQLWPAKGGWTGLLETAPQKVKLQSAED